MIRQVVEFASALTPKMKYEYENKNSSAFG
jgi:hypothetical protein